MPWGADKRNRNFGRSFFPKRASQLALDALSNTQHTPCPPNSLRRNPERTRGLRRLRVLRMTQNWRLIHADFQVAEICVNLRSSVDSKPKVLRRTFTARPQHNAQRPT